MATYWDSETQEYRPAATKMLWPKLSSNGHPISANGTEPRPVLSPVEQVVVAVVLTALLAKWWRLW